MLDYNTQLKSLILPEYGRFLLKKIRDMCKAYALAELEDKAR